jgi:hypothetical protein
MTLQYSALLRNNQLDQVEATTGVAALLRFYSGTVPANCAAAAGTQLRSFALPSDWMNAAATGSKTKLGTWTDASTGVAGTIGHFRIYDSTGTTCHLQGTVTLTGGGGDMTVDNTSLAINQVVTVNTFTLNAGNA